MATIEDEIKEIETLMSSKLSQLLNLYKEKRALEEFIKEKKHEEEYRNWRIKFFHDRGWNKE